jgi:hypothetical protein
MKPGLWEQAPYAFVLLPRPLNMIRPTEIEVFSSPLPIPHSDPLYQ